MSDFETVKAAVVKTLDYAAEMSTGADAVFFAGRAADIAHMLPADDKCALCDRYDCRRTNCPFADVRQYHAHTIMEGRVREGAGESADVFLCDTCDASVCRAEWLDGHGWVRAERPCEEPETDDDDEPTAALRGQLRALGESHAEVCSRLARLEERVTGIQETNGLWDGS